MLKSLFLLKNIFTVAIHYLNYTSNSMLIELMYPWTRMNGKWSENEVIEVDKNLKIFLLFIIVISRYVYFTNSHKWWLYFNSHSDSTLIIWVVGRPGWLSGWASTFGSGRDPGVPDGSRIRFPTGSLLLPLPVSLPLCVCHE